MPDADEPQQIVIPLIVLGQQHEMIRLLVARYSIRPTPRRDIPLDTDDRLDPRLKRLTIEIDSPVQAAMISERQRLKTKLFGMLNKIRNTAQAIQKTEF